MSIANIKHRLSTVGHEIQSTATWMRRHKIDIRSNLVGALTLSAFAATFIAMGTPFGAIVGGTLATIVAADAVMLGITIKQYLNEEAAEKA